MKGKWSLPSELPDFLPFVHHSHRPQIQMGPRWDCFHILFILLWVPDSSEHSQDESLRAKSYPVATDEIQGAKSTTLILDNTEMEHDAMLYVSNCFCFCL